MQPNTPILGAGVVGHVMIIRRPGTALAKIGKLPHPGTGTKRLITPVTV
jgi:hypothetical protein